VNDPRPQHPVVRAWFDQRFPLGPTPPQRAAWPLMAARGDLLVASPTGSGKTLTAFLMGIDEMWIAPPPDKVPGPSILYLSPLRALATDVRENLIAPLAQLRELSEQMGYAAPNIRVDVRTGDTSQSERASQRRSPSHIYVTTPETLYLLLTSASGRSMLRHVKTVIVDEIHAMCRDKRGSHLTLSLERLERLVVESGQPRPQRIGLSATQKPLELVGEILSGVAPHRERATILDCSVDRAMDLAIELPQGELDSVLSGEQFGEILRRLCVLISEHRTTLIFVQNRRLAERMAHRLTEALSEEGALEDVELVVASHHGSLSTHRRREVERRLRAGELRALVATSSLELGIDVGPVELVCQIGSPRSIAAFMQRVGRANHHVGGVPKGRLFPMNRHELVESIALLDAVSRGVLDAIEPPVAPLDILAQQMVAEVAARGEDCPDDLFDMVRTAAPYRDLSRESFDEILQMTSRGIVTGHGPRGAHIHLDEINNKIRPRRGASLAAIGGAGAIPDTGEYRVVLDPEGITVGTLDEDFAIESTAGDVFLLGTHAWRVTRVERSTVRVIDANGASPTAPFWLGESPGRTVELSSEVADFHASLRDFLAARDGEAARAHVEAIVGVGADAAAQAVNFLSKSFETLGELPTSDTIIVERFFDETESSHLVIHAPYGARINRALGLALRKRFCVTFDFELQAAADDDTVTIALGPHHSFALDTVMKMVRSHNVREVLTQAVLPLPMLAVRWRWNAARALVLRRSMNGQRRPINLQRMEADDLMAATWPSLAACQENAPAGPIPIPDHVLVRQTIADVLFEPLDVAKLEVLLARLESGEIRVHCVDTAEPSLLAHGIINGRPYTFLDDAPLEERRSRSVSTSRGVGELDERGLPIAGEGQALEPAFVNEVVSQLSPRVRSADELSDLLIDAGALRAVAQWQPLFEQLQRDGRALDDDGVWLPVASGHSAASLSNDDDAIVTLARVHLGAAGPVTIEQLISSEIVGAGPLRGMPLSAPRAHTALAELEARGYAMQVGESRWCARHTFARLNRMARQRRRASYAVVPVARYVQFLTQWQHVTEAHRLSGRDGLRAVIEQLQGVELAAGEWESSVLSARVRDYRPEWLDELCLSGEVSWARLTPRASDPEARGSSSPSAATPLALVLREDLEFHLRAVRLGSAPSEPDVGPAAEILEVLRTRGAQFRASLPAATGRLSAEVDEGIWDLVARGLVSADAYSAVRSLLNARQRLASRGRAVSSRRRSLSTHRAPSNTGVGEGRWSVIDTNESAPGALELEELAEQIAIQLVWRWGIVTYELFAQESYRVPWRYVAWALRRLEARGEVLGGRFVEGLAGEQYAHHDALDALARESNAESVTLAGCDPLNLTGGIVTSQRIPSRVHQTMTLLGGDVVDVS
jgi:ATP-dependent Lhr-like helicase